MSSFRALCEVIGERGLFCSLYADRASHYWHTPDAGGKVDKDNPTQVGRALHRLGIELIPAYSPEARGRSERMFGTLQKRLPQELRLAGISAIEEANRFLKEGLPAAPQRPLRHPSRGPGLRLRALRRRRRARRHPLRPGGPRRRQRQHRALSRADAADPARPATAATTSRPRSGCTSIPTAHSPSSTDPDASPATRPAASPSTTQPGRPRDPLRCDRPRVPVDKWSGAPRLTTCPQAQHQQQKRSTHLVHKPVSSECSRQACLRSRLGADIDLEVARSG